MPKRPDETEVVYQDQNRAWIQYGMANPFNEPLYGGKGTQYLVFGEVSRPITGGTSRSLVHDPDAVGRYRTVGQVTEPTTDLASMTIESYQGLRHINRLIQQPQTRFDAYILGAHCGAATDQNGWTSFVAVYPGYRINDITIGAYTSWGDSNEIVMHSFDTTLDDPYLLGSLETGAWGGVLVAREIVGVTFGGAALAAECGALGNGTDWLYALQNGAAGAPPNVIYSTDSGSTSTALAITGSVAAEVAKAIGVYRDKLLVLTAAGLYVATIGATGVPGAFTKVTAGFILPANEPNDMFIAESGVVIVGDAGYVYYTAEPLAGVRVVNAANATIADLNRVQGAGSTIYAGGAGGAVIKSTDGGLRWFAVLSASGDPVTATETVTSQKAWIGAGGNLYYTQTAGGEWRECPTFPGTGGTVTDIKAPTTNTLFVSYTTTTPSAVVYASYDGGYTWSTTQNATHKRVVMSGTYARINRIAYPNTSEPGVAANYLLLGGLDAGGTDGALLFARADMK